MKRVDHGLRRNIFQASSVPALNRRGLEAGGAVKAAGKDRNRRPSFRGPAHRIRGPEHRHRRQTDESGQVADPRIVSHQRSCHLKAFQQGDGVFDPGERFVFPVDDRRKIGFCRSQQEPGREAIRLQTPCRLEKALDRPPFFPASGPGMEQDDSGIGVFVSPVPESGLRAPSVIAAAFFEQAAAADFCCKMIGDVDADIRLGTRGDPNNVGSSLFPYVLFQLFGNRKQQDGVKFSQPG